MKYIFSNIQPFENFDINKTYLVLFYVNKIPPHLGIVSGNKYYSITIKYVENGLKSDYILKLIQKKKIPTLFVELHKDISEQVKSKFNTLEKINLKGTSCLKPIREIFDVKNANVIFDVLDYFDENRISYNVLSNNIAKIDYEIERYSRENVLNRIKELKQNAGR